MKHSPDLDAVIQRMAPGVLSLHGFLGADPRPLEEIIATDNSAVVGLGATHGAIADAMERCIDLAVPALGAHVEVGEGLVASFREVRGRIPCPFGGCGVFQKGELELVDTRTGNIIFFTPLGAHLIRTHGFYDGRGSRYRVEPEVVYRLLIAR